MTSVLTESADKLQNHTISRHGPPDLKGKVVP
jgi:hypothetical protein